MVVNELQRKTIRFQEMLHQSIDANWSVFGAAEEVGSGRNLLINLDNGDRRRSVAPSGKARKLNGIRRSGVRLPLAPPEHSPAASREAPPAISVSRMTPGSLFR